MAITESTAFDKVRLIADYPENSPVIREINLHYGTGFVAGLSHAGSEYQEGWDPTTPEFLIVKNAVAAGDATFQYQSPGGTLYEAADLPTNLIWMEEANTIKREIDIEQEIASATVSGANLAIYRVAASDAAPTAYPPEFSATNNTLAKWRRAIEDAGYALVKPTGDDVPDGQVVWETLAYYEYDAETSQYITEFGDWDTDSMRYSADNGQTWTTEPPVGVAGSVTQYHVITHYQRYVDGTGWVTFANLPDNHTQTGVVAQRSRVYTATNIFLDRLGFNADFPREWHAERINAASFVGWEWHYEDENDPNQEKIGSVEYPASLVSSVYPHEVTDENQESYGDRTFVVRMDRCGGMHVGRVAHPTPLDFFADDHRLMGYFRGFDSLVLSGALAREGATVLSSRKPTDVVAGQLLYIQNADETVREVVRTITVSQTPDSAGHYAITVQRGQQGTSAVFFPAGSTMRAGTYRQAPRAFVVTRKANLNRLMVMHLYRRTDQ